MAVKTRCKFVVTRLAKHGWQGMKNYPVKPQETVTLSAVYDSDTKENQSFSEATPNGALEIVVSNPNVVGTFELGSEYYIDLIPVE